MKADGPLFLLTEIETQYEPCCRNFDLPVVLLHVLFKEFPKSIDFFCSSTFVINGKDQTIIRCKLDKTFLVEISRSNSLLKFGIILNMRCTGFCMVFEPQNLKMSHACS